MTCIAISFLFALLRIIRNSKSRVLPYVRENLREQGYQALEEYKVPFYTWMFSEKISEFRDWDNLEHRVKVFGGFRIYKALDEDGNSVELLTHVKRFLDGSNQVRIIDIKRKPPGRNRISRR